MDITLSGKLYVYFIRSVFESKKRIGVEFIIDIRKSDSQLIDGLIRLNKINKNKIFIKSDNIKSPIKFYDKRYTCDITFEYINNIDSLSDIILKNIVNVEYEKQPKIIDNKFKLQNYSTGKEKTIQQIMNILA